MRILHVLSQVEITGAEAYAITLADEQIRQGHQVWIVSDTITLPHQATYISMPIANRKYLNRV
ncbi:MAG: polysaccharide deacetylase, partial [Bacteroidia bacterium]|nr:polysaccharide deacetylase [Bacteroidia bacterium]